MRTKETGLLLIVTASLAMFACSEPPPRNLSTPPPAPTAAPIANINSNDLKKMRRTNENRADLTVTNQKSPDANNGGKPVSAVDQHESRHTVSDKDGEEANEKK